jgi:hypothetical protein
MRAGPPLPLILLLFGGLFAALNWGVHRLSGNSVPRQVLRRVTDRDARTEVLAVGNSMIQSGFDPAAFAEGARSANPGAVANGGLGATGPVQHLLIGRAALSAQEQLRVLIYGCHDFLLVEPTRQNWWTLFGNNALVFYREPELAARHLAGNAAERLLFRLVAGVPLFRERGTLWAKVENFRRTLGGWGMPRVAENRFGRANDFNLLVKQDFSAFEQEASAAATDNVSLSGAVRQLLAEARSRNVAVKVVLMPRPTDFQPALATAGWQRFVRHLKGLLAEQGATLVDASAWATNGVQFMDPLHLNPAGAAEFSRRLGRELSDSR